MNAYKQNHYEGPIRRATSLVKVCRDLKDPDALDDFQWAMVVKGGIHFHTHPKTGITHQLWTDEKPDTVAYQKCIGYY